MVPYRLQPRRRPSRRINVPSSGGAVWSLASPPVSRSRLGIEPCSRPFRTPRWVIFHLAVADGSSEPYRNIVVDSAAEREAVVKCCVEGGFEMSEQSGVVILYRPRPASA